MKNFEVDNAFQLSKTQSLIIIVLGSFFVLLSLFIETNRQHGKAEQVFYSQVESLYQQQVQIENRITTLLDSLSQYYATNIIKSSHEFENFAHGLYEHASQHTEVIGYADLLPKAHITNFEQHQYSKGFESYKVLSKGIFEQTQPNPSHQALAISMVTPFTPNHAIYLGEDMLSIPQVSDKFNAAITNNKSFSVLLQLSQNQQFYSLFIKPLFLNKPDALTPEERHEQVRGAAFIVTPIEALTFQHFQTYFPMHELFMQTNLPMEKTPFFSQLTSSEIPTLYSIPPFENHFSAKLPLISDQPESEITIIQHWHYSLLKGFPLIVSVAIALIIYFILVVMSLLMIRYTKHLQQTQNRLLQIIKTSQDAVVVTDAHGYIRVWNPVAAELFGYSEKEALDQCIMLLIFYHSSHTKPLNEKEETELLKTFSSTFHLEQLSSSQQKIEVELHTQSGQRIVAEISVSLLNHHKNKDDFEISLFIKDLTYQRQTEAEIKQLAYYDPLTNLENRTYFKSQVERYIAQNKYNKFALLFLDLDGFKQVNDSLGHGVGDELLKVVSKRFVHTLRSTDRDTHICRFGGDEFVFMLGNVDEVQAPQVSIRLLKQIERVVKIDSDELQVTGSIGIAFYPQHGKDVDTLLRHADTAMYQSKDSGKNIYSIYNDDMEERLSRRLLLEKHLRNALALDEFSLVYQPKLDLTSGKVTGVEALVRWNNAVLGFVSPDDFISIAEESSLIINIGNWVAQHCIEQLTAWKNTPYQNLHIAINVSSQQLQHPYFLDSISRMMEEANLPTHLLEIELTERTIMSNAKENIMRFNEIREQGFELSVDDFGTGYSSLSYLKKFPLSILKIDKSFVDGLPFDEEDISIARAILSLAHNLNMRVVAEGVETLEQLEFLRNLECNYAQGYYISRPLSISSLETWLTQHQHNFYQPLDKV